MNVYFNKGIMKRGLLVCSMFYFSIFQLLMAMPGCTKSDNSNAANMIDENAGTPGKKYLALGDSYTIGQSVAEKDRFPAQTVSLLKSMNVPIGDPKYIATTGWTTTNLMDAINDQNLKGPYDVVSLLIGVNDQYQHMDTAEYRVRFTELINKSIALAGNQTAKVFVLSIPDYSVTPFVPPADKPRVSADIDFFNSINREVTLQHNITFIDITPTSREGATNAALIATDRLHPSGLEYKKWAEMLAPAMKKVL